MPLGMNRTDLNNTGTSYRNGTPVTLPLNVGTPITEPHEFGNPVPTSGTEKNVVDWQTPDPTHFGNVLNHLPVLSTPTFTPEGGTYVGTQSVTLTLDSHAQETYYTTDGSTPTQESTLYTGDISVSVSGIVKAVSFATGYNSSNVGSATYSIIASDVVLVAHIAATDNGSDAGTITTDPIDTTGANFLVVNVGTFSGSGGNAVSDSFGNTWHALGTFQVNGDGYPQLFYCYDATVGSGHTFTATILGTPGDMSIAVAAFAGVQSSDPFEAGTNLFPANSFDVRTVQAGSVAPDAAGDLMIMGLAGYSVSKPVSIDSGFAVLDQTGIGDGSGAVLAWALAGATSPVNPTWTTLNESTLLAATCAIFAQA
jgi:hypothetical protein